MIILTGSVLLAGSTITFTKWSNAVEVGQFVYAPAFPLCTVIQTVSPALLQATVSNPALQAYTGSIQLTAANPGTFVERCEALKDIKQVVDERGDMIRVFIRDEADVTRDGYSSIEKRSQTREIVMKAYPIEVRPSEKQLEKAGIRENADITIWTAMMDWITAGVDFNDIEFGARSTVSWAGNVYEIRDKNVVFQMIDTFLYITLGLFKR